MFLWYNYSCNNLINSDRSGAINTLRPDTKKERFLMLPHDTTLTKRCTKCGETKPTECFSRRADRPIGLQSQCKACQNAYRDANRDRRAEIYSAWSAANRERIAETKRTYRAANREHIEEYRRSWRDANSERDAETNRAWRKANPEAQKSKNLRRRARVANAEGTHNAADIQAQYKRQKAHCFYCEAKLGKSYHVDHIVPLSRGGSNWPDNIVCACASCNTSKGDKLLHEWERGGMLL